MEIKNEMKNLILLAAAFLIIALMSGCCFTKSISISNSDRTINDATWLYIMPAKSGNIAYSPSDDSLFVLTLDDPTDYVTKFTDRPDRKTKIMELEKFLDKWGNSPDDPPNAGIDFRTTDGRQILVVELLNPSFDPGNNRLTFEILPIEPRHGLEHYSGWVNDTRVGKITHPVLFIDDLQGQPPCPTDCPDDCPRYCDVCTCCPSAEICL